MFHVKPIELICVPRETYSKVQLHDVSRRTVIVFW